MVTVSEATPSFLKMRRRHFEVNRRTRWWALPVPLVMVLTMVAFPFQVGADDSQSVDHFETHNRPLLVDACVECHGEKEPSGILRLVSRRLALAGGDCGSALLRGDPGRSLMM